MKLRGELAKRAGLNADDAVFEDGHIRAGGRSIPLGQAAGADGLTVEDKIEFGDLREKFVQAAFDAHFVEVGVDAATGETRVKRHGYFVNHDLAEYHVPVHADIPHQDVHFLEDLDDKSLPMKAKGIGELGICGVGAAVANAIYNATGVRLREYPLTLDKVLASLPSIA